MKKMCILMLTLFMILSITACGNNFAVYDSGKDTIETFGDGTYQLLHQVKNKVNVKNLTNCKYNQCVMTEVNQWQEFDDYIYFVGHYYEYETYCILDTNNNQLKYYIDLPKGEEINMVYSYDMQQNNELIFLSEFEDFSQSEKDNFNYITNI